MAKYTGSVCRLCRREGLKLFLKGERCYTEKCAFERRSYAPGQHGTKRPKNSNYGLQLREKQKTKRIYGLMESQFRNTFKEAHRIQGTTGENLLMLLERRLDNVVYRLGFANSRKEARQLIGHNHFLVNDKKMNIASYEVSVGDRVAVREKSKEKAVVLGSVQNATKRGVPSWLELDGKALVGVMKTEPVRAEITIPIQEQQIVELYSK